jgi:hypothetical protein
MTRWRAVAWACLLLSACGGSADGLLEGEGFAFRYPEGGDWQEESVEPHVEAQTTETLWGGGVHLDDVNGIYVSVSDVEVPVTEGTLDDFLPDIEALVEATARQAGGRLERGPLRLTVASLPAVEYGVTSATPDGRPLEQRLVFIFEGRTEFFLNCQHTDEQRALVQQACAMALETFALR